MLMTVLHTAIAISSQFTKTDTYHYEAVNQKESDIKMSSVIISIPSFSKKEKGKI